MNRQVNKKTLLLIPALLTISQLATAEIPGLTGTSFSLTAKSGQIATGDGNSMLTWGFADDTTGQMQYPGPTLIVNEGDVITVNLSNDLAEPVSIVFPGQSGVVAAPVSTDGDDQGLVTLEADTGETVSYTFTASEPGTYMYQSGSNVEVQIEMGLVGALIVRPAMGANFAYNNAGTEFDREFLFFLTEMDRSAHEGLSGGIALDPAGYRATLWFINGRNGPDTMYPSGAEAPWLPTQPYGALVRAHPSERVLLRIIGAGRDPHPFHHHGNNTWQIAQDGRLLASSQAATAEYPDFVESGGKITDGSVNDWLPNTYVLPDQAVSDFTITINPGNTYDALYTWTGRDMNWDIYGDRPGHTAGDCGAPLPTEDPNSHCMDLSVTLPEQQALTFGGLWSGSPYMGKVDVLPPLEGGLNPFGGFSFMWHSHSEKELTNDDIFPGGMMTMFIVEDLSVPLP
jgi:FtsP/CotA-like multicopper oxidase with cupredoxin domain